MGRFVQKCMRMYAKLPVPLNIRPECKDSQPKNPSQQCIGAMFDDIPRYMNREMFK